MGDSTDMIGRQTAADEGITAHGASEPAGLDAVPHSPFFQGRFGRMFRTLPPLRPRDEVLDALAGAMRERRDAPSADNPKIPSGYTYLGQFIDHDITFDPVSSLQRRNDPDALVDFRTPRYDLDSLYGSGPAVSPYLYESSDRTFRGVKLLVGRNSGAAFERDDLPRNQQGRALIGDPRNDENTIVSQLQLLFLRFHNAVVDHVRRRRPGLDSGELFRRAQRITRWHYQWVVVHDFLERIVGREMARAVLKPATASSPPVTDLRFYAWDVQPFMPVEFSVGAYRFGHSMVRGVYNLNEIVTSVPIFAAADRPGPLEHLGGFRRLPGAWTVDWSLFFPMGRGRAALQLSRRIDTKIAAPLHALPPGLDRRRRSLAALNLRRGKALGLPSGQAVAAAMGETPLTAAELDIDRLELPAADKASLEADAPLWFYCLKEAEVRAGGEHLGPVAGRIVAEVLVGLLAGDPLSYLHVSPNWRPTLPAARSGAFAMPDLVRVALG